MIAAQNNDSAKAAMENLPQQAHGTTRNLAGKALADKVYDGAAMGDVVPPKKLLDKSRYHEGVDKFGNSEITNDDRR